MHFGVVLNALDPFCDFSLFEFFERFAERVIQLLYILELFAFLDDTWKRVKSFHWLVDSVEKSASPVESAGNRWHVRTDRGAFVNPLNQNLTLLEDALRSLQVVLEQLQKSNLLPLELIQDDGTIEQALE